jgi:predicted nucleic acid-binding protein
VILVDTSVWVDHLRSHDANLGRLLEDGTIQIHPFVIGELACSGLTNRAAVLDLLQNLPAATVAEADEVLNFIAGHKLYGRGVGYVDVHLLASAAIDGVRLWTLDQRLKAVAVALGCGYAIDQ